MFRSARQILGASLICVGALTLVVNFAATVIMGSVYFQQRKELTDDLSLLEIVFPFIIGFAFLSLGFVLREGKKRTLLFLRPFNSIADDLTMKSISGKIGASFTAVALDNGTMRSPRSSLRDRAAALFFFLPAGLVLLFVASVVSPKHNYENSFVANLPSLFLFAFALFVISRAFRCIFPKSNRFIINNEEQLLVATQKVQLLSTWFPRIVLPRTQIFHSSDAFWKRAVERIGDECEFAVIDVSRMSESIYWELNYLTNKKVGKFALMIREGVALPAPLSHVEASVLKYTGDLGESAEFSRALGNWLQNASKRLPFTERVILAEKQLRAHETNKGSSEVDWEAWAQVVFRGELDIPTLSSSSELAKLSLASKPKLPEADKKRAFDLVTRLANSLLNRPDILGRLHKTFELALLPLAWFQDESEFTQEACCLYAKLCHAIATHSADAYKVSAWLTIPNMIADGADFKRSMRQMQVEVEELQKKWEHLKRLEDQPSSRMRANENMKQMVEVALGRAECSIKRWCSEGF